MGFMLGSPGKGAATRRAAMILNFAMAAYLPHILLMLWALLLAAGLTGRGALLVVRAVR